jgi:hypothetical protein
MQICHGSCHCGAVRYEADIDLAAGTIKCNCSVCTKMRFWAVQVPSSAFRLLAGEVALSEYRFAARRDGHYFCRHCGINVFSTGHSARLGAFHAVTVASLDDVAVEELLAAPVRYIDGRNDAWDVPPVETRHL